ncbi:MAG: flagellar biosynthesis protein FlhF [Gammaproteobacteria bacterium]
MEAVPVKIIRLYAANIREAMRQVREQLGPEAVILSNKRIDEGVEIVAALDYDEQQAQPAAPAPTAPQGFVEALKSALSGERAKPAEAQNERPMANAKPKVVWSQDPLLRDIQKDVKAMHSLLQQQLSGLAWGEMARRQPMRADLLEQLLEFGLSPALCLRLADAVLDEPDLELAWRKALELLTKGLEIAGDDILTQGGVVALLGPTGVGKTTTVAKLAAHFTLRHGPRQVALITTDSYRIGAFDQLRTFGMILDIPVRIASKHDELQAAVAELRDKALILIDTAGMSPRDVRLSQQFTLIGANPQVKRYLVLAANAEYRSLNETVSAFSPVPLSGCILTKLDEAGRMGGVLSAAYERRLALAYTSDGQRIPEDLHLVDSDTLARLCTVPLVQHPQPPGETVAVTFSKEVGHGAL